MIWCGHKEILLAYFYYMRSYFTKCNKSSISISTYQKLLNFIWQSLKEQNKLQEYLISYNLTFDSVDRLCTYNSNIFTLDSWDNETIYLQDYACIDYWIKENPLNKTIKQIVRQFAIKDRQETPKAWIVSDVYGNEGNTIIFAPTRAKAKYLALNEPSLWDYSWTELHARRFPEFDSYYKLDLTVIDWNDMYYRKLLVSKFDYHCFEVIPEECEKCDARFDCSAYKEWKNDD